MREPNGFLNGGHPRSQKRATPFIREWCRFQPLSWPSGNRVQHLRLDFKNEPSEQPKDDTAKQ